VTDPTSYKELEMSLSPDWYRAQADGLRGRAEALRELAARLTDAPLFRLHDYAGEDTWQCPAAVAFGQDVSTHQGSLLQAIDDLLANANALADDAASCDRHADYLDEQHLQPAGGSGGGHARSGWAG
jgi:hypothetical protein